MPAVELNFRDCVPSIQGQQGDSDPAWRGTYIEPEEAVFSPSTMFHVQEIKSKFKLA